MNPQWQTHLAQAGAEILNNRVAHFGDPEAELHAATNENTVCDLSQLGLLAATGNDATTFLQGQFTADVARLTDTRSRLAGYCSPKGRLLACLRIWRQGPDWLLQLPSDLLEPLYRRLSLFVLRAAVKLHPVGDDQVRLGLGGPDVPDVLRDLVGAVPETVDEVLHRERFSLIRLPGVSPRFELLGPIDSMQAIWPRLTSVIRPIGTDARELAEIRAGLPEIHPETQDAFVPQMVNLDLLGGIDFDKGCYVGQEIVARTHYLGRLKRRMYRIRIDTDQRPQPGDELFAPDRQGDQPVGRIVRAAPGPDGGFEALAVIAIELADDPQMRLTLGTASPVERLPLPYAVPGLAPASS
jgi:tRNA-modifying protein YgfZ